MQSISTTAKKIRTMEIRGAGAIARAAASALKEHALSLKTNSLSDFNREMEKAAQILLKTRPTAVSLPNAVRFVMRCHGDTVEEVRASIVSSADEFVKRSEKAVEQIGKIGAKRVRDGDIIMTHCNSTAAISIMATAFKQGKNIRVIATESRPMMQGHITIQQLNDAGIPTTLIVDSAMRYHMQDVDLAIVGADAIGVNGCLVNKIGTSQLALAAHEARVNLLVAAETFKFSPRTIFGELIEIEERSPDEVLDTKTRKSLKNVVVRNPAFDVTPPEYIDLICTEVGAIPPEMAYTIIRDYLGWELEELGV
ncbi:MAG: ribose 1,5-bisphosphate isomerase [Methanosarcinales archaeon]|nr:MAG: ribose 1,5-bisphosphate isomerase [Methanosarcinales archaeon]